VGTGEEETADVRVDEPGMISWIHTMAMITLCSASD
jgi:hypothetical protein